ILVAQRTRELALLRALGASRRQVMWSVVAEAFIVGLFASLVGLGLGVLVALGLQSLLKAFGIDLHASGAVVEPRTIVVSLIVGVSLLSPLLARPLARAIGSPLPRLAGMSGKLGRQNAMRNPRRTAATAAALTVGLALVACVSVLAASIKSSAADIVDEYLSA